MIKLTFKDHTNTETKVIEAFSWNMLPGGHYEVNCACFDKRIINCKHYYLDKVEKC